MRGVFIDVETGGLDPKVHALTQIAAIAFDLEPGNKPCILNVHQQVVKPDKWLALSKGALDIQNRTMEELLENGSEEQEVYRNLVAFLEKYIGPANDWPGHIWAQDASFDHSFCRALETRVGGGANYFSDRCDWNCTKRTWTMLRFLGVHNETKTSLKNIIAHYGIRGEDEQTHDAADDATVSLVALGMMMTDLFRLFDRG